MTERAITLGEWQRLTPADHPALRGYHFPSDALSAHAAALTTQRRLALIEMRDGLHIHAYAYVGRVQLGDLSITVQPKVGPELLVPLFSYALGLRRGLHDEVTRYRTGRTHLVDLLVAQLAAAAETLLARGLGRAYVRREEWLASPRGRIRFAALATEPARTRAALPCEHHPRLTDTLLNRVLRAGLELGWALSTDLELRMQVSRLVQRMQPFAGREALTLHLLDRADAQVNRLTDHYAGLLQLIRALHLSALPDLSDDDTPGVRARSFLLDMNAFWQRLMERFLRDHLPGFRVHAEAQLDSIFRYEAGHNPRRRRHPSLRPDYTIMDPAGRPVAILDAKYRDLWTHELPSGMLYQLAIYAMTHSACPSAAILYPVADAASRSARIAVRNPFHDAARARVTLRPVDLSALAAAIAAEGTQGVQQRRTLAHKLAFGSDAPTGLQASPASPSTRHPRTRT